MITKERIDELIEQEATVYYKTLEKTVISIDFSKYHFRFWRDFLLIRTKTKSDLSNWYGCESSWSDEIPLECLYENKEDAEFVAKYHTQRPEYFNPPTYEEFLKLNNQNSCWDFMTKDNQRNFILVGNDYYAHNDMIKPKEEWTVVVQDEYDDYIFEEPLTKENYIKAVECARKLFLGESDD